MKSVVPVQSDRRLHRLHGRLEQVDVDHRLVVVGEIADRRRPREYQVIVLDRQEIGLARFEPAMCGTAESLSRESEEDFLLHIYEGRFARHLFVIDAPD